MEEMCHVTAQVGGNRKARDFLDDHTDWNHSAPIQSKYNTKAAALYRDKVGQKREKIINGVIAKQN